MKPYPFTTPPSSLRSYVLDDPEKALEELASLNEEAIILLIFNSPSLLERVVKGANRAARPIATTPGVNEPLKRVVLIEEEDVLAVIQPELAPRLPEETEFAETVAVSLVKGSGKIAHAIAKGTLGGAEMGTAFNKAIIELGNASPDLPA